MGHPNLQAASIQARSRQIYKPRLREGWFLSFGGCHHRHNSQGFRVRFYVVKHSLILTTNLFKCIKLLLLQRAGAFYTGLAINLNRKSAWVRSRSLHVKVLDLAPFLGSCWLKGIKRLLYGNQVGRVLKIIVMHAVCSWIWLTLSLWLLRAWEKATWLRD